jgi:hypothetical protein
MLSPTVEDARLLGGVFFSDTVGRAVADAVPCSCSADEALASMELAA